jgi:hypothetical protein
VPLYHHLCPEWEYRTNLLLCLYQVAPFGPVVGSGVAPRGGLSGVCLGRRGLRERDEEDVVSAPREVDDYCTA